ncbi:hypothetical protein ROCKSTAR_58 [Mycobacterium phage Rockstar]|uniref:Uncharacterized protein n=4 Tax=Veracruzvirus TaxID=2948946 RepID=A0A6M3T176_9CAUD|nr:hypothetical protein M614_gp57 [Mycobacterium phage BTCU-1]YP_009614575.1 hypothetical protein FDI65_gp28 [Mycobacterium phage Rockstar]QGJ97339.1 hypothetical protein PBI_ISCA_59 [Mycobacterium phage Isca]QJD52033.1 hypothetical protein PBI_MK4_60 [Mycobacterium phage MK4]QJD52190.1 hypothetical protein PBI_JF4_58 [Mycobacterium phage JF4]QJD52270.1 hypothetical protein PBI_JF2_58 [Mycobacterium phage JF2]BBC53774.1 hypothetical protein [Mycobacterium phage B1]
MKYEIKVIVDSERSEDNVALYAEGVLMNHFDVEDLRVRPLE